jgi:CheY-like chemotaxis protein
MRAAIKTPIFQLEEELKVELSSGYVTYPDDADNAKDLLDRADRSCVRERDARSKKLIMIVDDEPDMRDFLRKNLQSIGYYNIIEAGNGKEALETIEAAIPAFLILDLKMPIMGGHEVIGVLKENMETKDIPILLVSGYATEIDNIKEYVKKKAIPVVSKPFRIEQISRLMKYLL